jgi:hypothetical protein
MSSVQDWRSIQEDAHLVLSEFEANVSLFSYLVYFTDTMGQKCPIRGRKFAVNYTIEKQLYSSESFPISLDILFQN